MGKEAAFNTEDLGLIPGLRRSPGEENLLQGVEYYPFQYSGLENSMDCIVQYSSVAQSCLTLCNPIDCTIHGILQARILEWVTFPFSRESSQTRDQTQVSSIAGRFFTS